MAVSPSSSESLGLRYVLVVRPSLTDQEGYMTSYKGYNGTIRIDGEILIIIREGIVAKAAGLAGPDRHIPLKAVSGVRIKPATRLTNGCLTLGLGGAKADDPEANITAGNRNTVLFRKKEQTAFQQLHYWLVGVVRHNQATGTDYSSIQFEDGKPSLNERITTKRAALAEREVAIEASREAMISHSSTPSDPGLVRQVDSVTRPDVTADAARMKWKLGGRREINKLPEHFYDDETVRFIAQGTYGGDEGIVVLTSTRVLFLFHGHLRQRKEDLPLRSINSVQTKSGVLFGEIRIVISGNTAVIDKVVKSDLEPLADVIRNEVSRTQFPAPVAPTSSAAPAPDAVEQLIKLGQLRDAKIITEEDFAAKKAELLKRI